MLVRGRVLNVNPYGATVRLQNGDLASAPFVDVQRHRLEYERSMTGNKDVDFELRSTDGKRSNVILAPQIRDDEFEEKMTGFLRESEERLGETSD